MDYFYLCASKITLMGTFIIAAQFILALAILITIHEFGHFLAARAFKTRVEKFYLFFNPWFSIFKKKIGDTEWGLGWLPLGGYVKISGMIDESMDTEQLKQEPQPWEFRSKPAWQRLIIMLGGIIVNLIFGYLVYILVLWYYGDKYYDANLDGRGYQYGEVMRKYGFENGDVILTMGGKDVRNLIDVTKGVMLRGERNFQVQKTDGSVASIKLPKKVDDEIFQAAGMDVVSARIQVIVDSVTPKSGAFNAGLLKGDRIVSVNNTEIAYFDEFQRELKQYKNSNIDLGVIRADELLVLNVAVDSNSRLGFSPNTEFEDHGFKMITDKYSFSQAFSTGLSKGHFTLTDYVAQFKFVFTKKGASQLGGFISIAKIYDSKWNWYRFWVNTAMISFILAFMNLLPIPALDGGHVLFLSVEMITGKTLPQKFLEYAQMVGIILLLALMLYANGNDVVGLFKK